jgi:hypothetical protein
MQVLDGHISTYSIRHSLFIYVVNNAHCQLLLCIIVRFIIYTFVSDTPRNIFPFKKKNTLQQQIFELFSGGVL